MARDVILGESLEPVAVQADLHGFLKRLLFAPTLIDDAKNHHEGSNPVGSGAGDQHWVVGAVAREIDTFAGGAKADHRTESVLGSFGIGVAERLAARREVIIQTKIVLISREPSDFPAYDGLAIFKRWAGRMYGVTLARRKRSDFILPRRSLVNSDIQPSKPPRKQCH